jgi:DnaJ-class molecular chaperone
MPGMQFNMGDIFGNMFGGGGPRTPSKRPKGSNKVHEMPLSLADFYTGKKVRIDLDREVFCSACDGKGHLTVKTCNECRGSGVKETLMQIGPMMAVNRGPCGACRGEGTLKGNACGTCSSKGVVTSQKLLNVTILPGSSLGETIVFPEACSDSQDADKPGDLHIRLTAADEGSLDVQRDGVHLRGSFVLSLTESLLGCIKRVVNHPGFTEGLQVPIPAGTQRKEEVILQGKGMPDKKGGFGDFIALIDIKVTHVERESLKTHAMDLQSLFQKDPT